MAMVLLGCWYSQGVYPERAEPPSGAYSQPMDPTERELARARLLAERTRLLEEIDEAVALPEQMTYGSQAAAATQVFEQERELAMRERANLHLQAVDGALARLDDGTYGTCVRCGRPIAAARLEALPWAAHCIECQTIVDRGRR
jgi:RNA polymerase-binding protein DksA